jgi:topoisomerase-4 subunit A
VQSREEFVIAVQVLGEGDSLVVHAGKRHHKLKFNDLEHYRGERGRRGNKLPRGFQKVDAMVVERREG